MCPHVLGLVSEVVTPENNVVARDALREVSYPALAQAVARLGFSDLRLLLEQSKSVTQRVESSADAA